MTKVRKTALLKAYGRQWTPFEKVEITSQMEQDYPLLINCMAIYANSRIECQLFKVETSIGGVVQATFIRHGDIEQLTWEDIQRALHEIFGPEVVAVEVYPALTDEWQTKLHLRVLWVLPSTYALPFGLGVKGAWGKNHA
jgi:hypothetical protein